MSSEPAKIQRLRKRLTVVPTEHLETVLAHMKEKMRKKNPHAQRVSRLGTKNSPKQVAAAKAAAKFPRRNFRLGYRIYKGGREHGWQPTYEAARRELVRLRREFPGSTIERKLIKK